MFDVIDVEERMDRAVANYKLQLNRLQLMNDDFQHHQQQ